MLSGDHDLPDGIGMARLAWTRLPTADGAGAEGPVPVPASPSSAGYELFAGGVESLDYEVIENYAYREEQAQRSKFWVPYYVMLKWLFSLLIGVAAGSGIPEIKGYLNGVDTHGILLFRTLVGKIFGSIGSVGGGLALGKEGPLVHTGACIASLLGQVTCGCAAGVAAAFRAPVGGVLFALEEVTSWWRSHLMWRVFFTSAVVAVVVRSAMNWCKSGKCGHFGSGGFIIWDISGGQEDYSYQELLPMAIIGVIGGLLGALFNQLTLYITKWRRTYLHKKGKRVKIFEACLISLITSTISFVLPLMRKCSPCPQLETNSGIECPRPPGTDGNFVNFYCSKDNEYNDLATIFFNSQVMFYSLAVVTFGTAVPAGQFVPGIMIGSTYGRLVGMFVVKFYKKLNVEEGTYALLGAASFLGGSMRMTVSLCVIMVEITNNLKLLPLIMLVLLISKAVGDFFNEGLYEVQAQLRGIPLLDSRPKQVMRNMSAKDACKNQKVVSLPRVSRIVDIISVLRSNKHNGFPVVDRGQNGESLVIGLILRSHLLVLLQSKVDFQNSPFPCGPGILNRHNTSDFVKPPSSKGKSIDDIHLTEDELGLYLDLAPFLNPSPYIVPEDMSLAKVYNLFRQLGLRHIFVVPRPSRVVGLITRQDLLLEENGNNVTTELQSTSVRGQLNGKMLSGSTHLGHPLLDSIVTEE
uniref:Chloride channel protein n=1 Tax=Oryza punctata TaxID=4537 RepID=A0A0E0KHS0_ORYPU